MGVVFSARSNTGESEEWISAVSVRRFKSVRDECRLEIRPLTILAGANSSGKSSAIQPLLLLKQTLEANYDPGALLLDGPNVHVTKAAQVVSRARARDRAAGFQAGIELSGGAAILLAFRAQARKGFTVASMSYRAPGYDLNLRPNMTSEEVNAALGKGSWYPKPNQGLCWVVDRNRCFLQLQIGEAPGTTYDFASGFATAIRSLIHVPGLRGNPMRTYRVSATGPLFPGTFENYVAGILAQWQSDKDPLLEQLASGLASLGLTWRVAANPVDETMIELLVSWLPPRAKGAATDLVSIADVGFGVSQVLPVLVALLKGNPGQLVYIEQPELHLHPRAQTQLAGLLADAAKRGVRVVAETHSPLLLLGIQTLVAEGKLSPELVKLHWFTRDKQGATKVTSADLDEAGTFGDWPEDFGDVELKAESRFLDASEKHLVEG